MIEKKKDNTNPWLLTCALLLLVPLTMLRGYVLIQLWQWFAVPLGVPAIGLWHGCGVAVLVSALTQSRWAAAILHGLDQRDENKKLVESMVIDIVAPLMAWGVGTIFHSLM